MKFRLKVGNLYGPLDPAHSNGRTYGMYMVPWIKSVKEVLGTGLKETKVMADYLRDSVESVSGKSFNGAYVTVDAVQFPCLSRLFYLPPEKSIYIEIIDQDDKPGLACTVGTPPGKSVEIIKAAMCQLIELSDWNGVRRLAEVLMDIEDEQSC
ncbi:hypothetical protein D3C76_1124320 [compost metagenome]